MWSAAVGVVGDSGGSSNYKRGPNAVFVLCVPGQRGSPKASSHDGLHVLF